MTEDNRLTMENPSGEGSEYSSPVSEAAQGQPAPETQLQESLAEENRSPVSEAVQEQPMQQGFAEENSSPAPGMAQEQATEGQSLQDPGTVASRHPVAEFRGLTKKYGSLVALNGVSFQIGSGRIVGLLGPNGSGKTTTIRMLCGLLKPDGGSGSCLGYDFRSQSEAIRLKTGYMTQKFGWYDDLSVRENLEFIARLFAVKNQKAAVNQILDRLYLAPRQNHLAGSLSGGWKQRLALAMCLVHGPELLLLDEPTAGVDPKARREFWDIIHELAQDGITVLVSTHYMDEAERCHELIYIAYGKILARGTQTDIIAGYDLNVWQLSGDRAGEAASLLASNAALSVSAFGNGYHVTAKNEAVLQDAVKGLAVPRDELSLIPIKASLEDVFIHLLELYKDERF